MFDPIAVARPVVPQSVNIRALSDPRWERWLDRVNTATGNRGAKMDRYFILRPLIRFLNLNFDTKTWLHPVLPADLPHIGGELLPFIGLYCKSTRGRKRLYEIHQEVIADLSLLISPGTNLTNLEMSEHLKNLINKINSIRFRPVLTLHDARPTTPLTASLAELIGQSQIPNPVRCLLRGGGSALLRVHKRTKPPTRKDPRVEKIGEYIIQLEAVPKRLDDTKASLYAIIAQSLMAGTISMIRECPWCHCFFPTNQPRMIFCHKDHKRAYHDKNGKGSWRTKLARYNNSKRSDS